MVIEIHIVELVTLFAFDSHHDHIEFAMTVRHLIDVLNQILHSKFVFFQFLNALKLFLPELLCNILNLLSLLLVKLFVP